MPPESLLELNHEEPTGIHQREAEKMQSEEVCRQEGM